jgi:hypothetical protein
MSGVCRNLAVAHLHLRFWTILLPLVLACVTSSVAAPAHVALIIASWPHTLSWMQSGVLAWSDDGVEEEKKQIGRARHEKGCHDSQLLEKPCTAVEEEEETFYMRAARMHAEAAKQMFHFIPLLSAAGHVRCLQQISSRPFVVEILDDFASPHPGSCDIFCCCTGTRCTHHCIVTTHTFMDAEWCPCLE